MVYILVVLIYITLMSGDGGYLAAADVGYLLIYITLMAADVGFNLHHSNGR